MTTGITSPASALVTALNSLQKPMILTPCWPRAGPTGGAGLACPAGICSLICPVIFFAISAFFHLPVFEFHGRVSSENIHGDFQLAAVRLDLLNHTAEIEERPIVDFHGFTDVKADLRPFMLFGRRN